MAKPNIEEVSDFLCEYSSKLLSKGAYTSRVIRCTERVGKAFGYRVHLSIFLKYITINITDIHDYNNRRTQVIKNDPLEANLNLITNLSALSWQIYDDKISLREAKDHYNHIIRQKRFAPFFSALFLSLANAAFCKLFDGDIGALICIFCGSFVGFWSRYVFQKIKLDMRAQFFAVAFISSFVAYIGVWLGITATPGITIGGSVLYLIPGVLIINAFVDVIHENTLMGISRAVNMIVLMICLAAGVYITLRIGGVSILNV